MMMLRAHWEDEASATLFSSGASAKRAKNESPARAARKGVVQTLMSLLLEPEGSSELLESETRSRRPERQTRRGVGGIPRRPSVPPERSGGGSVSLKIVSRKV